MYRQNEQERQTETVSHLFLILERRKEDYLKAFHECNCIARGLKLSYHSGACVRDGHRWSGHSPGSPLLPEFGVVLIQLSSFNSTTSMVTSELFPISLSMTTKGFQSLQLSSNSLVTWFDLISLRHPELIHEAETSLLSSAFHSHI